MILRRYGSSVQSVETNFDARALTEIGFRRDGRFSSPSEAFEREYAKVEERSFTATSEGPVQDEAERALLADLEEQLGAFLGELGEGEVLLVESEPGHDHPKTHCQQKTVAEGGDNRLHFRFTVEPPLRVGRYRREG